MKIPRCMSTQHPDKFIEEKQNRRFISKNSLSSKQKKIFGLMN